MKLAQYDILLTLEIRHSYFASGKLDFVRIYPGAVANATLQRRDCLVRNNEGVLNVLCNTLDRQGVAQSGPQPAFKYGDRINLYWEVEDRTFMNYTDLSFRQDHLLYASNYDGQNYLPPGQLAVEQLPLKSLQLRIPLTNDTQNGQAGVELKKAELVGPPGSRLNAASPVSGHAYKEWPLDLRMGGEGLYVLTLTPTEGEALIFRFYATAKTLPFQAPAGVVEWLAPLPVPPEKDNKSPYTPPEIGLKQNFSLDLASRSTFWRYYLIRQHGPPIREPRIRSLKIGKSEVTFSAPAAQSLPTGQEALCITSEVPIPLQERPDWEIMLESSDLNGDFRLPYASPDVIRERAKPPDTGYYSDVYVYV